MTHHLEVGNQDIDVVFHVEPIGDHEQDKSLYVEGIATKSEVLKFTKSIRDFVFAICN